MNADLEEYSAIRVIRYISVNPRELLVFGFVSPLSLKSCHAAKTLQVSSTERAQF
jgi:hypothetical protein